MNESISLEEHEGELKMKPKGMAGFGAEKDKLMSQREVAEYLSEIVCQYLRQLVYWRLALKINIICVYLCKSASHLVKLFSYQHLLWNIGLFRPPIRYYLTRPLSKFPLVTMKLMPFEFLPGLLGDPAI